MIFHTQWTERFPAVDRGPLLGLWLLWAGLLVAAGQLQAQQCVVDSLAMTRLPVESVRLAARDHLDNIYLVTGSEGLEKYGRDGRLQKRYANNRLGRIASIDVSNPLKVLVWYGDFRTVVLLDRNLTFLGQLELLTGPWGEVRTVGAARDGNLWIYDDAAFTLRKIDPEGRELYVSQELNLLLQRRVQIAQLIETDDALLALTSSGSLLHFDPYAQFQGELPTESALSVIGVHRGQLYYRQQQPHAVVIRPWPLGQARSCLFPTSDEADRTWLLVPGLALRRSLAGWQAYYL